MGPPPFGDGNIHGAEGQWTDLLASMGPPPFGDGNRRRLLRRDGHRDASMGPPPFGDGNSAHPNRRWPESTRFNGATAFRRWKLGGLLLVDAVQLASMGPPPFGDGNMCGVPCLVSCQAALQWGHRLSAMETHESGDVDDGNHAASMEPPPFGDGNSVWPPRSSGTASSFNGATAFRRWKRSENIRGNRQHPYFNGAVAELQKITYRGKHSRKGLELGNNRMYSLWE